MSRLIGKARTAETYLAGLGASGTLIAGAIVAFLLLAGAVTFDVWPRAAGLFGSGDAGVDQVDADVPAGTYALMCFVDDLPSWRVYVAAQLDVSD